MEKIAKKKSDEIFDQILTDCNNHFQNGLAQMIKRCSDPETIALFTLDSSMHYMKKYIDALLVEKEET